MPRQTNGLQFKDRIARLPGGFLFRCQRSGHSEVVEFLRTKRDAEDARTNHDHEHHTAGAKGAGRKSELFVTVGMALDDLVTRTESLEAIGKRDAKTSKYYRDCRARLVTGLGRDRLLVTVTRDVVQSYIIHRLRGGTTDGSRILKELKALTLAAQMSEVNLSWKAKSFVDDIRPEAREKRVLTKAELRRLFEKLPESARDFAFTKLRTVLRNEELYDLRVGNVDLDAGVIRYRKRAKRKTVAAVQIIAPDLVPVLRRRCAGRALDAFVFEHKGRAIRQSSFRKVLIAASKLAEITPPVTSLGWIRHMVLTEMRRMLGVDDAAGYAGHSNVVVIEQHYDLDAEKLDAKRRGIEANVVAFPVA
jgi:integrase